MEWMITADQPGKTYLLQGNEAIARGALEAGVRFAAAYPGSPGSEILTMLGHVAKQMGIYAEWSTNEVCSFQACLGASFAKTHALCVMKQNGLLITGDALFAASLSGCRGGFVLVVTDDPSAHSSTNEFDSRHQIKAASIPLLEPSNFQEAKDMVKYAFELSEELQQIVAVRGVTRICHGRGNVVLGELPAQKGEPAYIKENETLLGTNMYHRAQLKKLDDAQEIFEHSPFNSYTGPEQPELIIVASGSGLFYSREAVERLQVADKVGILKLGTTWPIPEQFIASHLKKTKQVLVIEEVDPFIEQNLALVIARNPEISVRIYGRYGKNAYLSRMYELHPDMVIQAVASLLGIQYTTKTLGQVPPDQIVQVPNRDRTFCAGCPHRATFFILKQALDLDERGGLVMGDIGCYSLGRGRAGHYLMHGLSCMGGGINMAEGLGQLERFGFNQPVVALAGDSTFFHACLPGLVNAKFHNSNMIFIVLDNSATAMTGFQPHPGTGITAMGDITEKLSIEKLVEAVGCKAKIADPYQVAETTEVVYDLLQQPGLKVLVLRRACATLTARSQQKPKVWVDPELCRGDECGCNRFCTRVWGCPANIWDYSAGKAKIDEVICIGCGVCSTLCPAGAIKVEGGMA